MYSWQRLTYERKGMCIPSSSSKENIYFTLPKAVFAYAYNPDTSALYSVNSQAARTGGFTTRVTCMSDRVTRPLGRSGTGASEPPRGAAPPRW